MKKIFIGSLRCFSLCLIVIGFVQLTSCSKPGPTAQEIATAKLTAGAWSIQSASVDGVDQSAVYSGFKITFNSSGFSTVKGGPTWPATGTWNFVDSEATTIKRDDDLEVQIALTDSTLKLTFIWTKTTLGGGRIGSVAGRNVFTLTK